MLLDEGYHVKVVGHSLGAGVASLLVADLKNGLFRRQQLRASLADSTQLTPEQEDELLSDTKFVYLGLDYENVHVQSAICTRTGGELEPLPEVKAVCYAPPPCVGETLANAFLDDDLILSMVNGDDIVPRLSGRNIQNLADEVKSFASTAEFWMKDDEARMKRYARTIGKEGRMKSDASGTINVEAMSRSEHELIESVDEEDSKLEGGDISIIPPFPKQSQSRSFNKDNIEPELSTAEAEELPIPEKARLTSGISTPDIMVVPGKIAHFTKPRGVYKVSLCDYRVASLSKISLLRDSVEEHHVSAHITALRSHKLAKNAIQRTDPPVWESAFDEKTQMWACCSVCQSDPTWPFITNSEASRALVYNNCRACGRIVCVMCAPAGDSIPDSGIGEYQTLYDHRIPMPSLGILTPERVCMPCYLHCYDH